MRGPGGSRGALLGAPPNPNAAAAEFLQTSCGYLGRLAGWGLSVSHLPGFGAWSPNKLG